MPPPLAVVDQRFGPLYVVGPAGKRGSNLLYECRCDCGRTVTVQARALANPKRRYCSRLCGLWRRVPRVKVGPRVKGDRNAALRAAYATGRHSLSELAQQFGLTRQRVHQIVSVTS